MMLTIYNGNFGLVRDVREVRLPGGTTEVQFVDVAAGTVEQADFFVWVAEHVRQPKRK